MYSTLCRPFLPTRGRIRFHPNTPSLEDSQLSGLAELVPAVVCSFVTTTYITQEEFMLDDLLINTNSPLSPSKILIRMIPLDLLECMSPGLVLGSCLVLGCCLSSYVHRRRDQDEHQAIVFVIWIIWAICVGWGIGASANMTTLGIVPWALCAAMFSSFVGHAGARWLSGREKCESRSFTCDIVDEKGTLFKE